MDIFAFNVTIKRSDGSHFTYVRGWEGYTEELARRSLLNELHQCELQIVAIEKRTIDLKN